MAGLHYVLIATWVLASAAGLAIGMWSRHPSPASMVFLAIGFIAGVVHMALERREANWEEAARVVWENEIRETADDVSLDGYGIASLDELGRYHDALGREEVLDALKALPKGQRYLITAARQVEPDAAWD